MTIVENAIQHLQNNHRHLFFLVTMLTTFTYLAILYFKFFSKVGTIVPSELIGLHVVLLSGYTAATQAERIQKQDSYKQMPGEWLAVCWVVSFLLFAILHTILLVGDGSVLSDIWPMPMDLVLGLFGVNYVFKQYPQAIQRVGQKLAGMPATNGDKNSVASAPPTV